MVVCSVVDGQLVQTPTTLSILRLNRDYDFVAVASKNDVSVMSDPTKLVLDVALHDILVAYRYWMIRDLVVLCRGHHFDLPRRRTLDVLKGVLNNHACSQQSCYYTLYVFKARSKCRKNVEVALSVRVLENFDIHVEMAGQKHRVKGRPAVEMESNEGMKADAGLESDDDCVDDGDDHLNLVDETVVMDIVKEWQDRTSLRRVRGRVCAVCSAIVGEGESCEIDCSKIDLTLLRNEAVPHRARPSSYNFEAYDGALLDPMGLKTVDAPTVMIICLRCEEQLQGYGRMPKFALANFLYYGFSELPADVREAFMTASVFERMLVSRARASRICVKFSDIVGHELYGSDRASSQKCVSGNVIINPQDALNLTNVLPPSPEYIKDTLCALFVGKNKPTRAMLSKLNPILVRKTRVMTMIKFLVDNNPYYKPDEGFAGFSQRNLDELFSGDDKPTDEGVPCAIEVDFVPLNVEKVVSVAVGDYSGRSRFDRVSPEPSGSTFESELLIENVGFTDGDNSAKSYKSMTLAALTHCLRGGLFVKSVAGSIPIPDFENPSLLGWLFPHLDPWGIGGFHHPARVARLSLEEQLRHLLSINDRRFELEANFAFVYYNIHQKKSVLQNVSFSTSTSRQASIVKDILTLQPDKVAEFKHKVEAEPMYEPCSEEELRISKVLKDVNFVGYKLPGTHAYKFARRSEIRSLITYRGTATLFITLNPADIHHPLVRIFAGGLVDADSLAETEDMREWRRRVLVAKRPAAAARFFDFMITMFVEVILRFGRAEAGLFGKCTSYYGMVETQGRGTLHCHLLVWLKGHLSPQALRDKMVASEAYRAKVFGWLENIIKCHLPGDMECVVEPAGRPLTRPVRCRGDPHPASINAPVLGGLSPEAFKVEMDGDVTNLVKDLNWHEHRAGCFKYVKRGQKITDDNKDQLCRMRIDGSTRRYTALDDQTHAILLMRLHPRIAPYNDIVMFCMRCNMDIKFIGSGQAAKALMYYVTDYITKDGLPLHVALTALIQATRKLKERAVDEWYDVGKFSRSALTTVVNSMMVKHEMSHQQVMSAVVGGGDHYTPEKFAILYRGAFSAIMRPDSHDLNNDVVQDSTSDGACSTVMLRFNVGKVTVGNQYMDYVYRSRDAPYDAMSLYEFVECVQVSRMTASESAVVSDSNSVGIVGRFSNEAHPLYKSHINRRRKHAVIPVLLGAPIPRPDRSDADKEVWSREILLLFKPWRDINDLCGGFTTWAEAFDQYRPVIKGKYTRIIKNINILSECRDAREEVRDWLKPSRDVDDNIDSLDFEAMFNSGSLDLPVGRAFDFVEKDGGQEVVVQIGSSFEYRTALEVFNRFAVSEFVDRDGRECSDVFGYGEGRVTDLDVGAGSSLKSHTETMKCVKKRMRDDSNDELLMDVRLKRRKITIDAGLSVDTLSDAFDGMHIGGVCFDDLLWEIADGVIAEKSLADNPEQLRAFKIIARHVFSGRDQLLMYIAGVGGTGKSHLVQAVVLLFERIGRRNELVLGGPTGISAVVIGGTTLHKLVMWSDTSKKRNFKDLRDFWCNLKYLVVDEISMVSARFLSVISSRLQQAKGEYPDLARKPFGGVNMIFMGDFGQLRPVRAQSVFAYNLTERQANAEARNADTISAVNGAFLWRQVNVCVVLKVNKRQEMDPEFAGLLSRIRVGRALGSFMRNVDGALLSSDLDVLRARDLNTIASKGGGEFEKFRDAPVIVGDRMLRDELNALLLVNHARRIGSRVRRFYSRDTISRSVPTEEVKQQLWTMPPKLTTEFFGRLPLFVGMKVLIIENIAVGWAVVNGAEGTVTGMYYDEDESGRMYLSVVYVHVPGSSIHIPGLEPGVVPIFPVRSTFEIDIKVGGIKHTKRVSRLQVPLVPAYAYTDFKSQGRTLEVAIVDLASAYSLQGIYVMLSRVKTLDGIAVLRWFSPGKIYQRLAQDIRDELARIDDLDNLTCLAHSRGFV